MCTFRSIVATNLGTFDLEMVKNCGDWLYGQMIVQEVLLPVIPSLTIPKQHLISLPVGDNTLQELVSRIENTNSFAIKYSRAGKDFLGAGVRGANSSRGRKLDTTLGQDEMIDKLGTAVVNSPADCKTIVLQELDWSNRWLPITSRGKVTS